MNTDDGRAVAIQRLVADEVLNAEQAEAVLAALRATDAEPGRRGWWVEALGYVGGGLMLSGAALLVGLNWDVLTRPGKLGVLGAVFLVLIGVGGAIARLSGGIAQLAQPPAAIRRRVVGVLLALASAVLALAMGVAVDSVWDWPAYVVGLLAAGAGYLVVRTVPGLLTVMAFSVAALAVGLDELSLANSTVASVTLAVAFVALGAGWLVLSLIGWVVPRAVGAGLAAAIALGGAQTGIGDSGVALLVYVLTIVVALACLVLYRSQRMVVLMVAGVLGISIAVPEAVWDVTNGAGGGAAILLVSGAVLLAACGAGLGLYRVPTRRASGPVA
jgi:hypothetical protein